MSSVVISGDTSGTITLAAPSVAGTNTLTLPAATGTVVISGTTPSFNGITFPATQVPSADANTLDDYEEGTWTPVITPSGGSLTSYTSSGTYTKVGNTVLIACVFQITNAGTASGVAYINGLPFTSKFVSGIEFTCSVRENYATGVWYFAFNGGGTTSMQISTSTNNAVSWSTNNRYTFSLTYQV